MQYDLNLTANGAQQIDVAGTYFKYAKGAGPIRVQIDGGGYVDLLPGQGMQGLKFSRLMVKDTSGALNTGALVAGDGQFIDARISGSVEVIDGGRSRTLENQAFDGGSYAGVVASQFPCVQLWNPAGSGKRIVVKRITGSSASSGAVGVKMTVTQLANLDKNVPPKLAGGAASTAQMRNANLAVLPTEPNFSSLSVQANVSMDRVYQEPILVQPGYGLLMWMNTLGADCTAAFEFYEESL